VALGGDKKPISTTASTVVTVVVGAVMVYLGVTLVRFGFYALGEDEPLLGVGAVVLGALFVAGPAAVIVSQVRATLRRRRDHS
jgi:hypothetical protein